MGGYYTFKYSEDEYTSSEFEEPIVTKTFGEITTVPAEECPACPQSQAGRGRRGKAGKCSPTEKLIEVEIFTDNYPQETSWTVTRNIEYDKDTYTSIDPVLEGGPYEDIDENYYASKKDSVFVPDGQYRFTIIVSDPPCIGICCGVYNVLLFITYRAVTMPCLASS